MWHHDVTNARTCQFFRRLFDRLPVRISTSDLHHRILRKKLYHIRAYEFGVQFSFKKAFSERKIALEIFPKKDEGTGSINDERDF